MSHQALQPADAGVLQSHSSATGSGRRRKESHIAAHSAELGWLQSHTSLLPVEVSTCSSHQVLQVVVGLVQSHSSTTTLGRRGRTNESSVTRSWSQRVWHRKLAGRAQSHTSVRLFWSHTSLQRAVGLEQSHTSPPAPPVDDSTTPGTLDEGWAREGVMTSTTSNTKRGRVFMAERRMIE